MISENIHVGDLITYREDSGKGKPSKRYCIINRIDERGYYWGLWGDSIEGAKKYHERGHCPGGSKKIYKESAILVNGNKTIFSSFAHWCEEYKIRLIKKPLTTLVIQ